MDHVLFSVILMRTALIQGMENANKTGVRFGWCANGGFLEGGGWCHLPTLSSNAACVFGIVPTRLKQWETHETLISR
jgi:hypothetical protein